MRDGYFGSRESYFFAPNEGFGKLERLWRLLVQALGGLWGALLLAGGADGLKEKDADAIAFQFIEAGNSPPLSAHAEASAHSSKAMATVG